MQIAINPKDTNTFASASLDRTIKVCATARRRAARCRRACSTRAACLHPDVVLVAQVWSITSGACMYTLEGHDKGVNCLDYYPGGEKPYLVSGADDKAVKVWDYQNKTCVQTLESHTQNVSVVAFHPELPVIISGSEDGASPGSG